MTQRLSSSVAPALETLYNQFERRYDIADPIQRVRDFTDPRDQEIVWLGFWSCPYHYAVH